MSLFAGGVSLVALIAAVGCAIGVLVTGVGASRRGRMRSRASSWFGFVAFLAATGACIFYFWGAALLTGAILYSEDGGTDSLPHLPCGEAGPDVADRTTDYSVSWAPLRFRCELSDGGAYTAPTVPAYINWGAGALGVVAVASGVLAVRATREVPEAADLAGHP